MGNTTRFALALAFAGGAASILAQQQPPPRFAGGVDLLTVQATVIGKDGRAVTDLQPGDFAVTVDGKPRKVLFARFYSADASGAAASSVSAPGTPITVAPADNTSRPAR